MINAEDRTVLLDTARQAIEYGLQYGRPFVPEPQDYPGALQQPGAGFVTLHLRQQLRGCIGSLEATRPLVLDVAKNAFAAAFRDPRFPPVDESEFSELEYHISILTPAEPLQFTTESDLLAQLRPHVDGLILEDRGRRGTFLPVVWESLPEPEQFLQHLKHKAGLPGDHWSDTLTVSRYTVEEIK